MKQKKKSIVDIAKQLKVSPTTISFVLNGKAKEHRVSDKVANKILDHVKKTGYTPKTFARGLRTGKSKLIGLMIEDISNPFFASIARLIEDKAYENGYKIMYCSTHNDTSKARELIEMFKDVKVDGYIIAATDGIEGDIQTLLDKKEKVVLFDRHFKNILTDHIVVNNETSCFDAVQHLITNGYKNIAFVTTDLRQLQMADRLNGYKKSIKKNNLKSYIKKISYSQKGSAIVDDMLNFLRENPKLDAVLFATNYLGIFGLQAITALKYRIPQDIGVIAFDDHIVFQLHNPPISTIEQPIEMIAEQVISTLLAKLNHNEETINQIEIPTNFIARKSSKKK